jgi:uncharacterized protein (PEP-CTERM system associated)
VAEFDQTALRVALTAEQQLGSWTLEVGPSLARSTLDGDGFEEAVGADLRVRRSLGGGFTFDSRVIYDDVDAGDERFAYLEGSRQRVGIALEHARNARVRVGYEIERNDRADEGVSASRRRLLGSFERRLAGGWTAQAGFSRRSSRYNRALVPRTERLLQLSLGARRALGSGWTFGAAYDWSDNDSSVEALSYEGQRVTASLSRGFDGD